VIGVNLDNATIAGGPADDTIVAGLGQSQQLTGGGGSDVFVFSATGVHDTITDFSPADDKLDFTMKASDFAITAARDGHAVVHYAGDTVDLLGVTPRQLNHTDFTLPFGSGHQTRTGFGGNPIPDHHSV